MVAGEVLTNGTEHTFDREQVIEALANFRKAWEKQAEKEGASLFEMAVGIGYVLGDIALILGLTASEQAEMLGPELRKEFFRVIR